jgi:outer membrane protein assembly factor BamB
VGLVCCIGRPLPALILLLGVLSPWGQGLSRAQFFPNSRFEPVDDVTIDLADSTTRTHLERAKAFLADRQWDDAVEILRQIMENPGGKMFEVADGRYISLRDYCHLRIAALPEPALTLYRDRVDAQARRAYEEGLRTLNGQLLGQVVGHYFTSSSGDDALYALGELALSQADYPRARGYWEKLIETPPGRIPAAVFDPVRHAPELGVEEAKLLDRWYRAVDTADAPVYQLHVPDVMPDEAVRALVRLWNRQGVLPQRLAYPATDLNLADVRARLVLVSILEGALEQAREDLEAFKQLHPQAEGKLGGRSGKYADLLASLIESSGQWSPVSSPQSWHTFAGNEQRNFMAAERLDLGELVWSKRLESNTASDSRLSSSLGFPARRVAEDSTALLSYHPIVVGDLALVAQQDKILGFNLQTGEPAWDSPEGVIHRLPDTPSRSHARQTQLGAPRFTLSVHGSTLFARLGAPVTASVVESPFATYSAVLKWFDLDRQAFLIREMPPGEEKWSFDGVPISDGSNLYVALRQGEVGTRTHAHVACYDVQSGKLRWRRFVAAAVTPGRGQIDEITHNLLTLDRGTLYLNTNMGVVAALSAADGEVLWISEYPRAKSGELNRTARYVYRDLTPCVYDRGRLFVAPADSERVFAFNAQTGELLWLSAPGCPEDAVHLLGVLYNTLVASGDRLWGFDTTSGRVAAVWPDNPSLSGLGRGVLMGGEVIWPTREALYHFQLQHDPAAGPARTIYRWQITQTDSLIQRGVSGGNLVVAKDRLLIATSDMLYAFRRYRRDVNE